MLNLTVLYTYNFADFNSTVISNTNFTIRHLAERKSYK